jgi:hypothetical protein
VEGVEIGIIVKWGKTVVLVEVEGVLKQLLLLDLETLHQYHHHKEILEVLDAAVPEILQEAEAAALVLLEHLHPLLLLEDLVEMEQHLLFQEHQ